MAKQDFRALCSLALEAWESDGDIDAIMNKIKVALILDRAPNRKNSTPELPCIPEFAEPYRELLRSWWEKRCKKHKNANKREMSAKSLAALSYAHRLGVLKEFCEEASERDWSSLGFAGFIDYLHKLEKDKKMASYGGPRSTVNMETHPSYRPLVVDEPITQQVEQVRLIVNRDEEFSF